MRPSLGNSTNTSADKRRRLVDLLEQKVRSRGSGGIQRRSGTEPIPLSLAQERLWFLDRLAPGSPAYNVPMAFVLEGKLDPLVLERVLAELVRRHEVLRTRFVSDEGGSLRQVVAPEQAFRLPVIDLSHLPEGERAAEEQRLVWQEGQLPFDLSQGPLFRATVLRVNTEKHILLLTVHHIIFDGWSFGIMLKEIATLYEAFAVGDSSPLPELPVQYADFALWQQSWMQGRGQDEEVAYWREKLRDANTVLELPTDHSRPAVQQFRGTVLERKLPLHLLDGLKELCRRENVTLLTAVLACFHALMYRYTGQEDLIVGTASANRNRPEVEPLIGFFVNLLPIRADLSGNPTFQELLQRVRTATLGALSHPNLPLDRLVDLAQVRRDASRSALVQVVCTWQSHSRSTMEFGGLKISQTGFHTGTAKFDLTVDFAESSDGLHVEAEYSTDLFEADTISRLLSHLENLLAAVIADPLRRVAEIPLLSHAEQYQQLVEWNQTSKAFTPATLHGLFEQAVRRYPANIAAVVDGEHVTYAELNRRANQTANALRSMGVGPETLVAICVERSLDMVVGILGILKAGGAYVPLDTSSPDERLKLILEDCRASVLVTQQARIGTLQKGSGRVRTLCMDSDRTYIMAQSDNAPAGGAQPHNLAYVIYTSGSTGRPKGVLIEHRAAAHFTESIIEMFEMGPVDQVLQFASLSFDVSVFEIFSALLSGSTLHLTRRETLLSVEGLTRFMQSARITIADLPPAILALLQPEALPHLRILFVGTEPLSGELVNRWASPERRFINGYGPTEATVAVTAMDCKPPCRTSPPIGRPMANHQAYLLDRSLNLVPVGVTGELYIGGVGLARGYLNLPDTTEAKFIDNPFRPGERLYRTGDLVRYLPDGNLEFVGRSDQQVKIRGFRIELGEIQNVLNRNAKVKQAVVVVREELPGGRGLVAYVVPESGPGPAPEELRSYLVRHLPGYMIPSAFVVIERIPLTSHGKIDHRQLPAPTLDRRPTGADSTAPRTGTEARVASIMAKLLGISDMGVHENFFDLGGNSIQVIQLVSRIRDEFGVDVPIHLPFESPTAADLAQALEHVAESSRSPLVPILRGQGSPLFIVHPVGGTLFCYREIACQLAPDVALWGFQAPGLEGERPPLETVEALAVTYLKALRQVYPHGPYWLAGWSMGGLVAYEMSRQLEAMGEAVRLTLIDTVHPRFYDPQSEEDIARNFVQDIAGMQGKEVPDLGRDFGELGVHERTERIWAEGRASGILPEELDFQALHWRLQVFRANVLAALSYRPGPFHGSLHLIRVEGGRDPDYPDDWGWEGLALQGTNLEWIPGNHYSILQHPMISGLVSRLRGT